MGKSLSQNEIFAFIKAIDKDEDGKISFEEFFEMVIPHPDIQENKQSFLMSSYKTNKTIVSNTKKELDTKLCTYDSFSNSFEKSKNILSLDSLSEKIITLRKRLSLENSMSEENSKPRMSNTPKRIPKTTFEGQIEFTTPKGFTATDLEEDEGKIVKILKVQIEKEREVDEIKKELSLKSDFTLTDSFRFFDKKAKGSITKDEFVDSLKDLEVFPNKKAMDLFFERYDKNHDGLLKFICFFLKIMSNFKLVILVLLKQSLLKMKDSTF